MAVKLLPGCEAGGMNRQSTGEFQGGNTTVYDNTMVDTCHYLSKTMECTAPRANPDVNCELWVEMMCQRWFINCNKCTTLARGVASG